MRPVVFNLRDDDMAAITTGRDSGSDNGSFGEKGDFTGIDFDKKAPLVIQEYLRLLGPIIVFSGAMRKIIDRKIKDARKEGLPAIFS